MVGPSIICTGKLLSKLQSKLFGNIPVLPQIRTNIKEFTPHQNCARCDIISVQIALYFILSVILNPGQFFSGLCYEFSFHWTCNPAWLVGGVLH
jgi:hypothetical protein